LATNKSAFGKDKGAVDEVERALDRAHRTKCVDIQYEAYLNRNAAVIHQKAGHAGRADQLIKESLRLCEHDTETCIRDAEILLLRGELSHSEKPIKEFLDRMSASSTSLTPIQQAIGLRILASHYALSDKVPTGIDILDDAYDLASENELGHQEGKIDHARTYFSSREFRRFVKMGGLGKMLRDELTQEVLTLRRII